MKRLSQPTWLIAGIASAGLVVIAADSSLCGALPVLAAPATATDQAVGSTATISPFLQDIKLTQADTTKQLTISLTNGSHDRQTFHLGVVDFGSLDETGGIAFAGSTTTSLLTKYSLAHWLKLDQHELTVDAGQKAAITATLTNDSGLQPGGHYAAIIATLDQSGSDQSSDQSSGTSSTGGQVTVKQQLTALVMVTKVGGEHYDLKLDSIKHDGNWQHLPQTVTLRFQNPGNVHVVPRGVVKVLATGVRQRVVSQGVINEESAFVLPGAYRQLAVPLESLGRPELWPAHYVLQVDYRYDGLALRARQEIQVSFLNLPVIVTGVIGLVLLIAALIIVAKRLHRRPRTARHD